MWPLSLSECVPLFSDPIVEPRPRHPSTPPPSPVLLQEVVSRGVADPARIAVGGHSYGAFMAANLLAHAGHLFACGIARSGAYNRCLLSLAHSF